MKNIVLIWMNIIGIFLHSLWLLIVLRKLLNNKQCWFLIGLKQLKLIR